MEDGHNYTFTFHSPEYAEGYDRIFRKKVHHAPTKSNANRGRGSVQKADEQTAKARSKKSKGSRRVHRTQEVRETQISGNGD